MERRNLNELLLGLAAIALLTADAWAYYHPRAGRLIQRDPIGGRTRTVGVPGRSQAPASAALGPRVIRSDYSASISFADRAVDPVRQAIGIATMRAVGTVGADALSGKPHLLEYANGANLYGYAGNSPVISTDPSGLSQPDCCGPDITQALVNLLGEVERDYQSWGWFERILRCTGKLSGNGWDITELTGGGCFVPGCSTGRCANTAWVQHETWPKGACYNMWNINYVLWGKMNKLCWMNDKVNAYAGHLAHKVLMHKIVRKYKQPIPWESFGWTGAGYEGLAGNMPRSAPKHCESCEKKWTGELNYRWSRRFIIGGY